MKAGIAGAGIMGRLLALALANANWEVTLFDANTYNCSMAAAGLLSPVIEAEKNEAIIYHLGKIAIEQYWPSILSQLSETIYFKKQGSLVLAHPQDQAELQQLIRLIEKNYRMENQKR